ncbi:MAG: HEAT repeat domain-containing protein [Proteobacteria bacterium]|nr:HEAT repeat domain-containing protein [Pseudomonadota bacterium]
MLDDDDAALKQIKRRTSPMGRLLAFAFVGGIGALAFMYYQRSEAYERRMDGVMAAGEEADRGRMLAMLRAELHKNDYDDVQERIIRNLGHFRDAEATPLLIRALDEGGVVRRAAALALARIGSPAADEAKPKLLAVLPHTDERDRPQVVWALAVLREQAATDAILSEFTKGLLQAQPDFDARVVATVFGVHKLGSSALTAHPEESVRALVATALAEIASPAVIAPLTRMIKNSKESPQVVRAAAAGLARTGDPHVSQPLFDLLRTRPELRPSVLDALKKSAAAPNIAALLEAARSIEDKRDLVAILRATHDPRAAGALAQLVDEQDPDVRVEAAHGLAELGDPRAVAILLELAKDEDDTVGQDAIDALRELGRPEAATGLLALLKGFPGRKASILRALGACRALQAGPVIQKELGGDDVAAAAKALGQIPYPKAYATLVRMLPRDPDIDFSRPSVANEMAFLTRRAAIVGLAYFGKPDPKAISSLVTIIEDPEDDFRLRRQAGQTLGLIADDALRATILQKITDATLAEGIRRAYVQGLWQKPDRSMAKELFSLFTPETPSSVRKAAALAIGYASDPDNDARLIAMLDRKETRVDAAYAVVLGAGEAAARRLVAHLAKDRDLREVLNMSVNSNEHDNYNLIAEGMFESGQVWRRLRVAEILRHGDEEASYSYAWLGFTSRLAAGWDGPGGLSARAIRERIYGTLTSSDDPELRRLAAEALAAINERGLLLAARDSQQRGAREARQLLLRLDRPHKT